MRSPRLPSFNGRLRDECLNAHAFVSTAEAQNILDDRRLDYNHHQHRALQDRTPVEIGSPLVDSRGARESTERRKDRTEPRSQVVR